MRFVLAVAWALLANLAGAEAAVTFTVNSPSDVVASAPLDNGVCETAPGNGVCTLRAAIMKANHTPGGPHTVNVPANLYTLIIPSANTAAGSEAAGALSIAASMNIIGAGASTTVIDANGPVTADRGFRIVGGIAVNIAGVTVRNGDATKADGFGNVAGGIYNQGTLTLTDVVVRRTSAC